MPNEKTKYPRHELRFKVSTKDIATIRKYPLSPYHIQVYDFEIFSKDGWIISLCRHNPLLRMTKKLKTDAEVFFRSNPKATIFNPNVFQYYTVKPGSKEFHEI